MEETMFVKGTDVCNNHRIGDGERRRVSFSDMPPQVWEVSEMYPSTFFYSESEIDK